jgi:hypothetical protein
VRGEELQQPVLLRRLELAHEPSGHLAGAGPNKSDLLVCPECGDQLREGLARQACNDV